ncbi:transposase [Streptomyces sp. cmx-4-7]
MRAHLWGPLAPVARENGRQSPEYAGHRIPDGFQRLLDSTVRDADAVRDDVWDHVAERLGPGGALIVDDTDPTKKGTTSTGVGRQGTGTSGSSDSPRTGVFAACAASCGRAPVDRGSHLTKALDVRPGAALPGREDPR